ncbi:IS4 family transposase [Ornithinibacillus halotolerans]|uniref:IS4 family transposase n=1 Tax=Ornithinibacillus halotolerans TaxID=1274357 RepID=A0A916SEB4_9BACI|nr:IS4 family transposase [Ornithinibacillus halotolerans]GGA93296.1 IS4 family transposase [Ornithinibacillus halotolerans]
MNKEIKIDNEIQLLAQELERKFSKQQISQWAIDTGFMKRKAKVKPMYFLLLCTLLGESFGQKSLTQLCAQLGATFNIGITTEGLNQRFNTQAVEFLKRMYQSLVTQQLEGSLSFIENRWFNRLRILDSSSFDLPGDYQDYKGPNGSGIKIQLEYELMKGNFLNLHIQHGKESDSKYPQVIQETIQPGDLCLRDLGYFSIDNLLDIQNRGGYFLSRLKNDVNLYVENDAGKWEKIDVSEIAATLNRGEAIQLHNVRISARSKDPLLARVVITKLTEEQQSKRQAHLNKKKKKGKSTLSAQKNISVNIHATNITQNQVKKEEIFLLYSIRWQIEILFKTWKSLFEIHKVKKMKKERFECHLYGTLIRLLLSSTLAFYCRRLLYIKEQMEVSEYKSISIVKESLPRLVSVMYDKKGSLVEIAKRIYRSIKINGRKCRRQHKQTVFDILGIAFKQEAS